MNGYLVPSFSCPSVCDDNRYSESLLRTLKYTPAYPSKQFESIEVARQWVHRFVQWCNHERRHIVIRYITPDATTSLTNTEHDVTKYSAYWPMKAYYHRVSNKCMRHYLCRRVWLFAPLSNGE